MITPKRKRSQLSVPKTPDSDQCKAQEKKSEHSGSNRRKSKPANRRKKSFFGVQANEKSHKKESFEVVVDMDSDSGYVDPGQSSG